MATKRAATKSPEARGAARGSTTAIHLPADLLELLRIVAVKRARGGGRPSVSAVIVELVERCRAELEAEARGG
jgi:hypothetical protein